MTLLRHRPINNTFKKGLRVGRIKRHSLHEICRGTVTLRPVHLPYIIVGLAYWSQLRGVKCLTPGTRMHSRTTEDVRHDDLHVGTDLTRLLRTRLIYHLQKSGIYLIITLSS